MLRPSVSYTQRKRGTEDNRKKKNRMQQTATECHPEINKDEKSTEGSRRLVASQLSVSQRLTKKEMLKGYDPETKYNMKLHMPLHS